MNRLVTHTRVQVEHTADMWGSVFTDQCQKSVVSLSNAEPPLIRSEYPPGINFGAHGTAVQGHTLVHHAGHGQAKGLLDKTFTSSTGGSVRQVLNRVSTEEMLQKTRLCRYFEQLIW
jgi:hypothetical protein